MLGKLIKHEFKAVSKILAILHVAILFITIMGVIAINFRSTNDNLQLISSITMVMYVLILIAVAVAVMIFIIVRFYRNLFTDEGYLMNTLPVKSYQLIFSKIIVGFVWSIINGICTCASIFVLLLSQSSLGRISNIWNDLSLELLVETGLNINEFIPIVLIGSIVSVFYMLIMFYAAIAIGQAMGKHKVLFSLGAYIVLYVLSQIISTIILIPFGFASIFNSNSPDLGFFVFPVIYLSYAATIALIILYFVITNHILNKKLNLE